VAVGLDRATDWLTTGGLEVEHDRILTAPVSAGVGVAVSPSAPVLGLCTGWLSSNGLTVIPSATARCWRIVFPRRALSAIGAYCP